MRKSTAILTNLILILLSIIAFSERGFAEQVTVSFGNTVHAESANIDLTFESLSEGRCPGDVLCRETYLTCRAGPIRGRASIVALTR